MLGTYSLATRPMLSVPRTPRPFVAAAVNGEYGWAAWSFSRQAKLNAWAWHGVGMTNVLAWATLGDCMYFRRDDDSSVHLMQPDVFLAIGDTSSDSQSVEATTQWLDFGRVGKLKTLTGIDFDGTGVHYLQIYISENGDRAGTLADTVAIGDNNSGWTYNGEMIPLCVAATEFKVKFICNPNIEAQVNRVTFYYEDLAG